MIKLIRTEQLKPGMYVHDLNCAWRHHDFILNRFAVDSEATVERIRRMGVGEIYIDTARGLDVDVPPAKDERGGDPLRDADLPAIAQTAASPPLSRVPVADELRRARRLHREANAIVRRVMDDVRLGKQIELERIDPLVANIVDSIFRQPDALLPLARVKDHDQYTFMHSVSVCALIASFGRALALPRETIHEIAVGALLHDVGKVRVPGTILNKPAKLTETEFDAMKRHVLQSEAVLRHVPGVSRIALDVVAQHHERFDGSGYPHRLKAEAISLYGQMGAIVDVYDAITSDRVYHKAMPPTEALRKLLESSKSQFNPELVHAFIRSVGIYPAGSLVRLASGRLAVVHEQDRENLLRPTVKVIFDVGRERHVEPRLIDLRRSDDRIVSDEDFEKWRLDPKRWLQE